MLHEHSGQTFQPQDRLRDIDCFLIKSDLLDEGGFEYDKETIIFSRSFRRLSDKTQIYPGDMGDHYRSRLTHTLEVAQISGKMARFFNAGADLCEAISYGHDLGHTPFGHSGERILNEIMTGKFSDNFGNYLSNYYGGFNHNYQSVRVLDILETTDSSIPGKNMTWQVLEGVLKHTKSGRNSCNIQSFIQNERSSESFFMDYDFSVTIEGQIVHIADEIAQMLQDLDDGFKSPESRFSSKDLIAEIKDFSESVIERFKEQIENRYISENNSKDSNDLNHQKECLKLFNSFVEKIKEEKPATRYSFDHLQSILINYFLSDVLTESEYRISKNQSILKTVPLTLKSADEKYEKSLDSFNVSILTEKYIDFSDIGRILNHKIKSIIKREVTNTDFVQKFDSRAQFIIQGLFTAYYENPLLLPFYVRLRIQNSIYENKSIFDIKLINDSYHKHFSDSSNEPISLTEINMSRNPRSVVDKFIETLKLSDIDKLLDILVTPENLKLDKSLFEKENIDRLFKTPENSMNDYDLFTLTLIKNNIAFARCICDYISGMSDNYAMKEYRALFIGDV